MVEHPFLDMGGDEFASEVGCVHCVRVSARAEWERNRWHCPFEDCDGSPLDVWPPAKTRMLAGEDGP